MSLTYEQSQYPQQTAGRTLTLIIVGLVAIGFLFWGAFQFVPSSAPTQPTCESLNLNNPPPPKAGGYKGCGVMPMPGSPDVVVDNHAPIEVIPMPTMVTPSRVTVPPTPVVTVPPLGEPDPFG